MAKTPQPERAGGEPGGRGGPGRRRRADAPGGRRRPEGEGRPYPWPKCILIGAGVAGLMGAVAAWNAGTGLTWDLARSVTENAALVALVVRGVSASRDVSPSRLFRLFALALAILAANRALFLLLHAAASRL